jgi:hypothetical protein
MYSDPPGQINNAWIHIDLNLRGTQLEDGMS